MGASTMAVRTPVSPHAASAHTVVESSDAWASETESDAAPLLTEGRAERWATWVLIYLAALTTSLAIGASVWALGLAG
jgi:hypothetical protein